MVNHLSAPLLTVRQVADLLAVSVQTVYRMIDRGAIGAVRLTPGTIRLRRDDVELLLTTAGAGGPR